MTWERYVRSGWFNATELDRLDARIDAMRRKHREEGKRKFGDAQRELARVALVTRALAELMIAKGLITKDELLARIESVDLEDGVADGALDPTLVLPGAKPVPNPAPPVARPPSPKVLERAKAKVRAVRETQPPKNTPPTPELVARARERLKEAREKKRRRNLP
jgi:hypothetical protein